ncbi:hypothetical protein ACVWZV_004924 [Bradyrhizobium sp. GM5.1]
MRVGEHRAHQLAGLAGVDEIVDDQEPLAGAAAKRHHVFGDALQHFEIALLVVVIAGDADRIDHAHAKLARHDRRRHKPAAGDRDHRMKRTNFIEPPGQCPAIPVELVPRHRKGAARPFFRT